MSQLRKKTLPDFLSIPLNLFKFTGVEIFKWDPKPRMTTKEKAKIVMLLLQIFFNLSCAVAYIFSDEMANTFNATTYIVYITFVINAVMKITAILSGRKKIALLFQKMLKTFPDTDQKYEEYNVHANYIKIHKYNKYLMVYHLGTTTLFNGFPLLQSLVEYWLGHGDQFEYRFPYLLRYPFNEKRPIPYAFAYILQSLGGYNASFFFLAADLLLITSVHLINMQFTYLIKDIRRFKSKDKETDMQTLCGFLSYHNEIITYSEIIDDIFSVSILLNYLASCLVMCLIGFQIVAGTEILDLFKFFLFLVSTLVHIFYISLFGTEMMALSIEVGDAFGEHAWYTADIAYQRMLPLPIAKAQRSAHLTAFKFFIISMESFKTLMTTSYQFFTMIRTRLDENENA